MFSVIVPVYNDWPRAMSLLGRLAKIVEATTAPVEVVLVDNGSHPGTIPGDLPRFAKLVRCSTPGSYAARNEGRRHATQNILAFTDADCLPATDWLNCARPYYEGSGSARLIVAGHIEVFSKSRSSINLFEAYDMAVGLPQRRYVQRGYGITANLFIPAKLFDEMGGFDERRYSGGDAEFCRRSAAWHATVMFAPDVVVSHPARATWAEHSRKIRRTLGGQLTNGSLMVRIKWLLRAVIPPVLDALRIIKSQQSMCTKLKALTLLLPIWGVRVHEAIRVMLLRGYPRRA